MSNSIEQQLEVLAHEMGVHKEDVRMFAQSIVNSIKQDKIEGLFVESDEKFQEETIQAYAADAVKKFESFLNTYLTSGREEFAKIVLHSIKS